MHTQQSASDNLDFTGERMVPERASSNDFWEHVHRYQFAAQFVKGKQVLDIACGEGYGTASLSKAGVASVVGVDVSQLACEHARAKYGIAALVGNADNIPLADNSVDVVTSFETIEHLSAPDQFLRECFRVLKPKGLLIISTPDKEVYSKNGHHNHYHCSEMTEKEFLSKLKSHFFVEDIYKQRIDSTTWLSLRNLSAEIPWTGLKGITGLIYRSRNIFLTRISHRNEDYYRRNVLNAMTVSNGWFSSLFNPYLIRKAGWSEKEKAFYLIALARKLG